MLFILLAIGSVSIFPGTTHSFADQNQDQVLKVMTYNIYQGSELQDVLRATTIPQLLQGVGTDFGHVIANNFPERAQAIAAEVAATNPDLIGLQEVALWKTTSISPTCGSSAVTLDNMQILLNTLSSHGLNYQIVVLRNNFHVQSPGLFPCGLMNTELTDRSAILVRTSDLVQGDISLSNMQSQNFVNNFAFSFFGSTITLTGGWASVDVSVQGDTVRFISTHLDGFSPTINALQAGELVAGPMKTNLPMVFSGDLNTVNTSPSFSSFAAAGFSDSWAKVQPSNPGFTCCQTIQNGVIVDVINNPTSSLNQRIDYVLIRGDLQPTNAILVGADSSSLTASGLWPSDHAGLVVTLGVAQGNNQQ